MANAEFCCQTAPGNHDGGPVRREKQAGPDIAILAGHSRFSAEAGTHMIEASDFQGVFTPNGVKSRFARLFRDDRAVPAVRYCASTMSKLIAIAVLVAFASPAEAYSSVTTWGCKYSGYYGYSNCRRTY